MGKEIIEAQNVVFGYPLEGGRKSPVLRDVSLSVAEGSFVAVLGHNGSGKSTFAKHFNGILTPDSGTVTVCGINTAQEDRLYDIRRQAGMVFQNPDNQIVATIVEEDVAFGPENLGLPPEEIRRRVDKALTAVGMAEYMHHAPHQLSGGQKQRVAIARALIHNRSILLVDEGTSALDQKNADIVEKSLLANPDLTLILVSHHLTPERKEQFTQVFDLQPPSLCA